MPAPNSNFKERALAAFASVASTPGSKKPDPIIVADKVTRRFGGLTAVNVDHVEIQRGSITALIGPNGAGKTTFSICSLVSTRSTREVDSQWRSHLWNPAT